jgi:hypothetical protein
MKKFLAIYTGTEAARAKWNKLDEKKRQALQASGVKAWMDWGTTNSVAIVDQGSPLGKTKRASSEGIGDIKNSMTGYVIVQAESQAAAAKLFENHPHFTIFPGDSVEIMECLPLPQQ